MVKGGKDQVARLRSLQGYLGGLQVAHFTDQDDLWGLPQRRPKRQSEGGDVGPQLSLIFHTPLSQAQIDAFDLELHRLDYVRSAEVMTVQGPATVEVNLNKSVGKVPMELTPLRTKTDYLITAKDLKPGFYALQSNHLLDRQDAEAFNRIPEDLRIAFPFEVKD